jgi:hypothetical protein
MSNPGPPRWTAWHLPCAARVWLPICEGESSETCLAEALRRTDGGLVRVLPSGSAPPRLADTKNDRLLPVCVRRPT